MSFCCIFSNKDCPPFVNSIYGNTVYHQLEEIQREKLVNDKNIIYS